MAPSESESSRSGGNSHSADTSMLPWRRWRSHRRSVSKCSPSAVRTTSPAHQLLDEITGGIAIRVGEGQGGGRGRFGRPLFVDAGNVLPQRRELFPDVLHASLFICLL